MEKEKIDEEDDQGLDKGLDKGREEKGYFNNIVQELMIEDTQGYREMIRMTPGDFLEIFLRKCIP